MSNVIDKNNDYPELNLTTHVLIGSDNSNVCSNSLYIGKIENGKKYVTVKDEFGDELNVDDVNSKLINEIEKRLVKVNTNVNWISDCKILFLTSKYGNKDEALGDLKEKLGGDGKLFKLERESVQCGNNRYDLIPFITSSFVLISVDGITDKTLDSHTTRMLIDVWKNMDNIFNNVNLIYLRLFKNLEKFFVNLSSHINNLMMVDAQLIKTKITVDELNKDTANLDFVEHSFFKHSVDLRGLSSNGMYVYDIIHNSYANNNIVTTYVFQENVIAGQDVGLSIAKIESISNRMFKYSQSNQGTSGIYSKYLKYPANGKHNRVILRGGRRYHILSNYDFTHRSVTQLTYQDVIRNVTSANEYYQYFTDEFVNANKLVFRRESDRSKLVELVYQHNSGELPGPTPDPTPVPDPTEWIYDKDYWVYRGSGRIQIVKSTNYMPEYHSTWSVLTSFKCLGIASHHGMNGPHRGVTTIEAYNKEGIKVFSQSHTWWTRLGGDVQFSPITNYNELTKTFEEPVKLVYIMNLDLGVYVAHDYLSGCKAYQDVVRYVKMVINGTD